MKHLLSKLLMAIIMLGAASCSKDKTTSAPPDNKNFLIFQKHIWILDSTNTITSTYNIITPEIPPSTYTFTADSLTINFLGSTLIYYGVEYENPKKIYSWFAGEIKNPDAYMLIDSINEQYLRIDEIDVEAGRTRIRYLHAQ